MRQIMIISAILFFLLPWLLSKPSECRAQSTPEPDFVPEEAGEKGASDIQIIAPAEGEVLSGSVPVVVDTTTQGFQSVELTFLYSDDPSETAFFIYKGIRPVTGTMLVQWDTTMITDGTYALQMVVTFDDGSQARVKAADLHVRNYTQVETVIPPTSAPTSTALPKFSGGTVNATRPPALSPSPAPGTAIPVIENTALIKPEDVLKSVGKGAALVFSLFLIGGIFKFKHWLMRAK